MHSQGDDTFACDGTSSEITLNGMQGDDTFIIGQVGGLLELLELLSPWVAWL